MPEMGSQSRCRPKRIMSSSASQKVGMANPTKTTTLMTRSKIEPCFTAESTPMGMAMRKMRAMDNTFRKTVMGRRSRILADTGLASGEKDTPRSSTRRRPSHFPYWTCRGLSRSYRARRRSFISAVTRGFISVWRSVGDPGARCMTEKQITVIPKNRGIMNSMRLDR